MAFRIDWLTDWLRQQPQHHLLLERQDRGVAPNIIGATQIRFLLHTLGETHDLTRFPIAAHPVGHAQETLPVLLDTEAGTATAYPSGWQFAASPEVLHTPREYLCDFPSADPELFAAYQRAGIADSSFSVFFRSVHGYDLPREAPTPAWFNGRTDLITLRRAMDWHFGCDEALGVTIDPDTQDSVLPDGTTFSRCTNSAHLMAEKLGGAVTGFPAEANPTATYENIVDAGGHDFALIGDRYVVDLWVGVYGGGRDQAGRPLPCVYDLRSDDLHEQQLNQTLFGNPECWEELARYDQPAAPTSEVKAMPDLRREFLVIDMVDYDVAIENDRHLAIKDCGGSILANLDNDPEVSGNRYSDELKFAVLETGRGEPRPYEVSFDPEHEGGTCYFSPCDGKTPLLGEVEKWVGAHFDQIESIGCSALSTREEVDEVMGCSQRAMVRPG